MRTLAAGSGYRTMRANRKTHSSDRTEKSRRQNQKPAAGNKNCYNGRVPDLLQNENEDHSSAAEDPKLKMRNKGKAYVRANQRWSNAERNQGKQVQIWLVKRKSRREQNDFRCGKTKSDKGKITSTHKLKRRVFHCKSNKIAQNSRRSPASLPHLIIRIEIYSWLTPKLVNTK
jgi:hypothetical protein